MGVPHQLITLCYLIANGNQCICCHYGDEHNKTVIGTSNFVPTLSAKACYFICVLSVENRAVEALIF